MRQAGPTIPQGWPILFSGGGDLMSQSRICLDAGHGMSNVVAGRFDPGAVAGGVREADVSLDWA
ncbi:hypothetical protein C0431_11055 [bacterium]|nr:hypothetical protein [bacterium]